MSRLYLVVTTLFFSFSTFAQIATGSLFQETKSINPATISLRPSAVFSTVLKVDKVDKTQDLSTSTLGAGAKSDTNVKVYAGEVFYGGKGDGGITSELIANMAMGTKENKLSTPGNSTTSKDNVQSQFIQLGFGFGKNLGFSLGVVNYEFKGSYEYNFDGYSFSSKNKSNSVVKIPRIGLAFSTGLDWGIFIQRMMSDMKINTDGTESTSKQNLNSVGFGIGKGTKLFHTELSYERQLTASKTTSDGVNYTEVFPNRFMFALEFYISKVALGYTGFYYREGYMNLDNLLFNSLVYADNRDEPRLEHNFNFSFGSEKGHSFSGSLSFSKLNGKEKNLYSNSKDRFPTTTTSMGLSVKYAYIF